MRWVRPALSSSRIFSDNKYMRALHTRPLKAWIFAGAEKVFDFQHLLDPAKEQFNVPTLLVKRGDVLCERIEVIGEYA